MDVHDPVAPDGFVVLLFMSCGSAQKGADPQDMKNRTTNPRALIFFIGFSLAC